MAATRLTYERRAAAVCSPWFYFIHNLQSADGVYDLLPTAISGNIELLRLLRNRLKQNVSKLHLSLFFETPQFKSILDALKPFDDIKVESFSFATVSCFAKN